MRRKIADLPWEQPSCVGLFPFLNLAKRISPSAVLRLFENKRSVSRFSVKVLYNPVFDNFLANPCIVWGCDYEL
jgi:hypothetical protein